MGLHTSVIEGEPSRGGRSMISLKVMIFLRSSTIRIKLHVHLGELLVLGLFASLIEAFLRMPIGDKFEDVRLDNIDLDDLIGIGDEALGDDDGLTSCLLFLLALGEDWLFTG